MGTSGSSRGSGTDSPLVPDYAAIDGQGPVPAPGDQRFRAFRVALGKFVATGETGRLRSALGHFARTATGGSGVGPRRFGAMARTGGGLVSGLSAAASGQNISIGGLNLRSLNGASTDVAIQEIVRAFTPANADGERIAMAMQNALAECLEGMETFDFAAVTPDLIVDLLLAYVRECVFTQIMLESDRAFQHTDDAESAMDAENQLRELVRSAVDTAMQPLIGGTLTNLSPQQIETVQIEAIREIWIVWESYT